VVGKPQFLSQLHFLRERRERRKHISDDLPGNIGSQGSPKNGFHIGRRENSKVASRRRTAFQPVSKKQIIGALRLQIRLFTESLVVVVGHPDNLRPVGDPERKQGDLVIRHNDHVWLESPQWP
jgi:hypothetical protein